MSTESYPHCFRNVYFYLPSFGSAGSSLRRGLFAGCAERGCALVAELGLLTAVASPAAEQGLRGSRARDPEYRLSSCSPRAQMPLGMRDLPGSEIEAASPAPAGGFCTAEPPGKRHLLTVSK